MITNLILLIVFSIKAFAGMDEIKCPMGIGSLENEPPKIIAEYEPNRFIFACGFSDDESVETETKENGAVTMSGFEIYQQMDPKKPATRIKTVTGLDKHKIERATNGLVLTEIVKIAKSDLPSLETKIICQEQKCNISKPTCLFKKIKDLSPEYLREFKRYFNGKKKDQVPSELVIDRAARYALTGDKEAIALFLQEKPPIKVEGGAKEVFFKYQLLIRRLSNNHCI